MCDTVVATPATTSKGVMLFGKNSDREPNEAQYIVNIPAEDHERGSNIHCTFMDIPQVAHTHALLLSRPFWLWGGEIGVNEFCVAIGNEAVFTKEKVSEKGLLGMDLLRLGLERGATAREALDVITGLIEAFGQGGNGGYQHSLYYHNSFIIADPGEAWVLETAGKFWAAKKIENVYTISNGLTIQNKWDIASAGLVENAVKKGWCARAADFDFAHCYSDFLYTNFSFSAHRRQRTMKKLEEKHGKIDMGTITTVLRDHDVDEGDHYHPDELISGSDVCMHFGFGPVREHQTTGSLVCYLDKNAPAFFATCTSAPCTSTFKPFWLDTPVPESDISPGGKYNRGTLFWRHEELHHATLRDYPNFISLYSAERDAIENQFITETLDKMRFAPQAERIAFVNECFDRADEMEKRWLGELNTQPARHRNNFLYEQTRQSLQKKSKMN